MSESDWQQLLSTEALQLLDTLDERLPNPLTSDALVSTVSSLRKQGTDPGLAAVVLSQLKLRRKAANKFGEFAKRMLFTEAGLEQATRLPVAAHHAGRFAAAQVTHVADLGSGIGADSLALAALDIPVTAVERDPITAAFLSFNLAPFENAVAQCADVHKIDLAPYDALWFDPARRAVTTHGQKKLNNPADWSPNLDWVFSQAKQRPIGVKLSPALDTALIPPGFEAQWVSDHGSVVELTLWSGRLARPNIGRSALLLTPSGIFELNAASPTEDEPVGELSEYLYEPDGAVIRAQLIGDLSRTLNAHPIDPKIAYFSASEYTPTPFAQAFRVREVLPAKVDKLRRELASRDIGNLEIKKRGADLDPAQLRKQLKLRGTQSATLIMTRMADKHVAILADRIN